VASQPEWYSKVDNFEELSALLSSITEDVCVTIDELEDSTCFLGGDPVTVIGRGFGDTSTAEGPKCKFGDDVVDATWVSATEITCSATPYVDYVSGVDSVEEEFSLSLDGGASYLMFTSTYTVLMDESCLNVTLVDVDSDCNNFYGGTDLTVLGLGFDGYGTFGPDDLWCRFGGESGDIVTATYISNTELSCVSPPAYNVDGSSADMSVTVEVSVNGGFDWLTKDPPLTFVYEQCETFTGTDFCSDITSELAEDSSGVPIPALMTLTGSSSTSFPENVWLLSGQTVTETEAVYYVKVGNLEASLATRISGSVLQIDDMDQITAAATTEYLDISVSYDGGLNFVDTAAVVTIVPWESTEACYTVTSAILGDCNPMYGGSLVTVLGSGFSANGNHDDLKCRFGTSDTEWTVVKASYVDDTTITCVSPPRSHTDASSPSIEVSLEISVWGSGDAWISEGNDLTFTYELCDTFSANDLCSDVTSDLASSLDATLILSSTSGAGGCT
jgi:hypothetical protein